MMVKPPTRKASGAQLAAHLRDSITRLNRRLRQARPVGDLTITQLSALTSLELSGALTPRELADAERVQPPTMTKIVAGLVEEGLVARTPDPLDRRIAWLTVTPEGRKLLARRRRNMDSFLVKRLRSLPPEDVATLERAADIIAELTEEPPK